MLFEQPDYEPNHVNRSPISEASSPIRLKPRLGANRALPRIFSPNNIVAAAALLTCSDIFKKSGLRKKKKTTRP